MLLLPWPLRLFNSMHAAARSHFYTKTAPALLVSLCPTKQVPRELLEDKELAAAMSMLPKNYNFEVRARLAGELASEELKRLAACGY